MGKCHTEKGRGALSSAFSLKQIFLFPKNFFLRKINRNAAVDVQIVAAVAAAAVVVLAVVVAAAAVVVLAAVVAAAVVAATVVAAAAVVTAVVAEMSLILNKNIKIGLASSWRQINNVKRIPCMKHRKTSPMTGCSG